MVKELVDGQEYQDGIPVDRYKGRYSGTWETDPSDGAPLSTGELVAHVVISRVSSPKFDTDKKSNELVRSNTYKIEEVIQLSIDRARYLLDSLDVKVNGINDGLVEVSTIPAQGLFDPQTQIGHFTNIIGDNEAINKLQDAFMETS